MLHTDIYTATPFSQKRHLFALQSKTQNLKPPADWKKWNHQLSGFFCCIKVLKEANYKGHYCRFIPENNFRAVSLAGMKSVSSFLFSGYLGRTMRIDFLSDSPETLQGSHLSKKGSIMFPYCTCQGRKSKRIYFTETPPEKS